MKRSPETETVQMLVSRHKRGKIDLSPKFQRGAVWGMPQKRLLVDTILRNMDIPKIYLREVSGGKFEHEVVDGQQRLLTVIGFSNGEFKTESTKIDGQEIPSVNYKELEEANDDLWEQFNNYGFNVVFLRDTTDDEVEDMFLRLQNGTPLNAPEKRNAMPGNMRDFVRDLSKHAFFRSCGFRDHRYAFAHVASQMVRLELGGGECNIKKPDLDKMYRDEQEFDENSATARETKRTLADMLKAFPEKTPEIEKHNAISLFLLFRHLRKNFAIGGRESEIGKWFVAFEKFRMEEAKKPDEDERDNQLVAYQEKTSHSTDAADSLEYRQKVLRARLFEAIPDLDRLDKQRSFTDGQRLAIWRRDKGVCQLRIKCEGAKCEWDDSWHVDHKTPWSQGGKTTVENGQVSCAACNLAKGDGSA